MKEHPILFSGKMVNAIFDGCKTQTRRIVKLPDLCDEVLPIPGGLWKGYWGTPTPLSCTKDMACPFGVIGDRLWVRETWYCDHFKCDAPRGRFSESEIAEFVPHLEFRASHDCRQWEAGCPCADEEGRGSWVPSIFMPRWASRITLEVTDVRVEHLWEIDEGGARAEGVEPNTQGKSPSHLVGFMHLWDEINGKRASWDSDPFVWVVEFAVIEN